MNPKQFVFVLEFVVLFTMVMGTHPDMYLSFGWNSTRLVMVGLIAAIAGMFFVMDANPQIFLSTKYSAVLWALTAVVVVCFVRRRIAFKPGFHGPTLAQVMQAGSTGGS